MGRDNKGIGRLANPETNRRRTKRRVETSMAAERESVAKDARSALYDAKSILKDDPTHVGALESLAKAQWQEGHREELLMTLARLIELNPYEPGYHALQAATYHSLGICGEAVKSYLRATDLGQPSTAEMKEMVEELRAWQAELVAGLLRTDPVFRAAYQQDPAKACGDRGFDFAVPTEDTEWLIRERESRATVFARHS